MDYFIKWDNFQEKPNINCQIAEINGFDSNLVHKLLIKKTRIIENTLHISIKYINNDYNNASVSHIPSTMQDSLQNASVNIINHFPNSMCENKSLTYFDNISCKILNILKPFVQISYKPSNSLGNYFWNNQDKIDVME